jgi:ketosteroid isomerase-like protein
VDNQTDSPVHAGPLAVVRGALDAYVSKDRGAIEALIAESYHFTSPLDNALDRDAYFKRCWPNSTNTAAFKVVHEVEDGDLAFVEYEGRTKAGTTFRNCELHTVRDGKLVATKVYFGWDFPHKAPEGGSIALTGGQ